MSRPPLDPSKPLLTKELIMRICLVGFMLLVGSFGIFEWELRRGSSLEAARTCATNIFVLGEMFYLFNCRSLRHSMSRIGLFNNRWVLGGVGCMLLQLLFTYPPVMNTAFVSHPIDLRQWGLIIVTSLTVYIAVECAKWLRHWRSV